MKGSHMDPQVQEKVVLDTVAASRGPRIEDLEKTSTDLDGPELRGGLRGPAGKAFLCLGRGQAISDANLISQFRRKSLNLLFRKGSGLLRR